MKIRDTLIVTFWTLFPLACFGGGAVGPTIPVPEPGTLSLIAIGAVAVAAYAKRPKK